MPDGKIVFSTKIDNTQVDKDLKRLERKIRQAEESISINENAKLPLVQQLDEVNVKLDEAKAKLENLKSKAGSLSAEELKAKESEYKKAFSNLLKTNEKMLLAANEMNLAEYNATEKKGDLEAAKRVLKDLQAEKKAFLDMQSGKVYADPQTYIDAYSRQDALDEKIKKQQDAVRELRKEWNSAAENVDKCQEKYRKLAATAQELAEKSDALEADIGVSNGIKAQEKEVATLQKQCDSVNNKIDSYDAKIKAARGSITANAAKANALGAQMTGSGAKMSAAFASAREAAARFGAKLVAIGKQALIFSAIAAAFQTIRKYMSKLLKTNEEYTAQLAQLKAALATAFQPIYEFILPGLMAVMRILTAIVSVIANVLSIFSGKTTAQSAKNAKALNEEADAIGAVGGAAKDAKKELAGFDEINTLGSPDTGGGGGGGAGGAELDFSAFDTAQYKAKNDELTVYLSGALLALGAILAFSGANIPLGIGLMAAGAIGLVAIVKANWGAMSDELKGALTKVALVLGGAALAIGAILAFSGINLPLGIGLMVVGAAALASAVALNWSSIASALQGPVGEIVAIASAALLGLGLILAFSGANIPLGIALMVAGAVGLVTVGALNWNAIQEKLAQVWAGIKQWFTTHVQPKLTLSYWQEKFSAIADALVKKIKDGVNAGIALFNRFISWVNEKMRLSWGDFTILGEKVINAGSFQLLTLPQIPMLAQGAVLPANKPFLAMVGDQKNGTNVEAPLETIKQALAEVMAMYGGDGDIVIRFEGDLAQLARVLAPVITRENKRVGPSLAGGNT